MYIVWSYFAYLAISLGVTIWVARALHKDGRIFLVDAFHGNTALVKVGFFAWVFPTYAATNLSGIIHLPSYKLGTVLLTLCLMMLVNLFLLFQMRNRAQAVLEPSLRTSLRARHADQVSNRPPASSQAARRFPALPQSGNSGVLVVIGDNGAVYFGDHAWIMCLCALRECRATAKRLSFPMLQVLAREAFTFFTRWPVMMPERQGVIAPWCVS